MKIYQNKTIFCFGFWALGCPKKTKKIKKWSYRWSEPFGTKRFKTFIFLVIFWFLLIRVAATFFSKTFFCTKKRAIFFKKMALQMVFGLFKNYPIFRYIIYDFLKKVSRGSRPTCLAKILCATSLSHSLTHRNQISGISQNSGLSWAKLD